MAKKLNSKSILRHYIIHKKHLNVLQNYFWVYFSLTNIYKGVKYEKRDKNRERNKLLIRVGPGSMYLTSTHMICTGIRMTFTSIIARKLRICTVSKYQIRELMNDVSSLDS